MYPQYTSKILCLESLVGIRTGCTYAPTKEPPFFIEDIEGVTIEQLASIAPPSYHSGNVFGKWLINSAARELMADIESAVSNGYSMRSVAGEMCSTCQLLPSYVANAGIVIQSAVPSNYQRLRIPSLTVLTNVTGERQIAFNDGKEVKLMNVQLQAGVRMPINLTEPYETAERKVQLSFTDPTVGLGQVQCTTQGGCGCGGSTTGTSPVLLTGIVANMATPTQYGFIPCVTIGCSYDTLVCKMIQNTPNIFGQALLFKIGEKYYYQKAASDRNNSTVSYNEEEAAAKVRNYSQLYWARIKGTSGVKGIKDFVSAYLARNAGDKCVQCDANRTVGWVGG